MAQVNYNEGVADTSPDVRAPDDLQKVQPTAFQGMQQLGQGASVAGQYFGQVAADDATNQFQAAATKILHGDPNQMVPGPDGTPVPDTGYLGKRGADALNARPQVEKQLDSLLDTLRSGLQTPEQQLEFDRMSKQLRSRYSDQIGTHTDQQSLEWGNTVQNSTIGLGLNGIAANASDPGEVQRHMHDVVAGYVRKAQINGAQPNDPTWNAAVQEGQQKSLAAWVDAVAATDPVRAVAILDRYKGIAGTAYEPMRKALDGRRIQAIGAQEYQNEKNGVPSNSPASGVPDIPDLAPGGAPISMGVGRIERTAFDNELKDPVIRNRLYAMTEAEVGGQGPQAQQAFMETVFNRAQARGLTLNQVLSDHHYFPPQTFDNAVKASASKDLNAKYGSIFDAVHNGSNVSNFATGNASGSVGFGGGPLAYTANGERFGIEAQDAQWATAAKAAQSKASTSLGPDLTGQATPPAPPVAPATAPSTPSAVQPVPGFTPSQPPQIAVTNQVTQRKMSAFERIDARTDLTPEEKIIAKSEAARMASQDQFMEVADARAKKEASDKSLNTFYGRIAAGDFTNIQNDILNDPQLDPAHKASLYEFAQRASGQEPTAEYGKGYADTLKRIVLPAGDPNRITEPSDLIKMEAAGMLTSKGVQKLATDLNGMNNSVDGYGVQTTKSSLINYAKSKLSFEQDTGPVKIRDPKGEEAFNAKFIPAFEAGYDKWVQGGGDPHEFLTKDNVDKIMAPFLRSSKEMGMDKMAATGEAPPPPGPDTTPVPPAPQGVNPDTWNTIAKAPPQMERGQMTHENWAAILRTLASSPDENTIKWFDYHFGSAGYRGQELARVLAPKTTTGTSYYPAPGVADNVFLHSNEQL